MLWVSRSWGRGVGLPFHVSALIVCGLGVLAGFSSLGVPDFVVAGLGGFSVIEFFRSPLMLRLCPPCRCWRRRWCSCPPEWVSCPCRH